MRLSMPKSSARRITPRLPDIGAQMPPFMLPDETGRIVDLQSLCDQGPVAVMFHRGHWCPYCLMNLSAVAREAETIASIGARAIVIQPARQHFAGKLQADTGSPFPVLSDMDNGYALSLNLAIWLGAEMQKMMAGRQDLPAYQGNSSWMLPIPATFVVGQDGMVKARFVDPDYRKRMAIEDLLAALKA